MDTIKLTPLAAVLRPTPPMQAPAFEPGTTGYEERIGKADIAGLSWTFRNGFDRVLARTPAAAWCTPEQQNGWIRIKHNAQREVWRARVGEQVYYLKYYRRNGWAKALKGLLRESTCAAEWNCGIYLLNTGITAVTPDGFVERLSGARAGWSLLVTEAVEPAVPLNEFWPTLQADEQPKRRRADRGQLIELLAEMIARAHQAGFEHLDLHAANILVQTLAPRRYRTLFVDLHSARLGVPISDRAVVRNLAQLNQWFHRHASLGDRVRFLRAYLRWRNEYEHAFGHARPLGLNFEQLFHALVGAARTHARRLWAQRDRRIHREGRYFARLRLGGLWRARVFVQCKHKQEESRSSALVLEREWWSRQLRRPLEWLGRANGVPCKRSHSAVVQRIGMPLEDGELPVIVKRPLARNWQRVLRQVVAPSRSMRAWRLGHALLHRDVATARPLALLERRLGPLVLDSLLITEALPHSADLEQHLRREFEASSPREWVRQKRALVDLLVRQLRRLEERGFAHRDCKAQNILVVRQPRLRLVWIDMDGLRLVADCSWPQRLAALMRLHVSLLDCAGLTRTDRARFLRGYFARFGADPRAWRWAWQEIAVAADKKIRRKATRRAWKVAHYGRE